MSLKCLKFEVHGVNCTIKFDLQFPTNYILFNIKRLDHFSSLLTFTLIKILSKNTSKHYILILT
jgi:hypothetical protein